MKSELSTYFLKLFTVTMGLAIVGSMVFTSMNEYYFQVFPLTFLVCLTVSFASHAVLLKAFSKNSKQLSSFVMLAMFLKIIIYSAFAILVLIFTDDNRKAFVITLLIEYLVYTIFDVREMLQVLKGKS